MKSTLIKFSALVLLVFLLLAAISKGYDFALRENCNIKAAYVQKWKIDAELLIHGPCEPLWMISPAKLDQITGIRSYNLSLSHSDFADNYLHLYFYLKNNKAPKTLFLYVTPESMDRNYNTFNTYRFAPYMGDPVVDSVLKECDPAYFKWRKVPFMKYAYYNNRINFEVIQGMKHYLGGRSIPHFPDGYEPPEQVVWDNHLEEFIRLYPEGYQFTWDKLRQKYLEKIIQLSQQAGTAVYLYESPVLEESLKYQPNRKEMMAGIETLAAKYGIKYARFQDMEIARSRDYYMSTLNTNLLGSGIFTDSLGKYIKKEMVK